MWEGEIITSYHIKSFSPFCVSVPNSAVAQNGAVRKRLPLFSFFHTSMNRAAFFALLQPLKSQTGGGERDWGEKLFQRRALLPLSSPERGTLHLRNCLLPTQVCLLPVQPHVRLKRWRAAAVGGRQFVVSAPQQRHGEAEGVRWRDTQPRGGRGAPQRGQRKPERPSW